VRAVFLADEKGLFLPELEFPQPKSGQEAASAESETNPAVEEPGDSHQNLTVVSRDEVEEYLTSLYSKTGERETQIDSEVLNRFTLNRFDKKDFSLFYDPESLQNLERNPKEGSQSKKFSGLLHPYGPLSPLGTSPQPLGQPSVNIKIEDLTPWAEQVLEKIERNWTIDPTLTRDFKITVSVSVTITKSGDISSVEVIKSSGEQILDLSAVDAVKKSIPLPSLPMMYPSKTIVFTIEFEYDV
jgi:TonB family protein